MLFHLIVEAIHRSEFLLVDRDVASRVLVEDSNTPGTGRRCRTSLRCASFGCWAGHTEYPEGSEMRAYCRPLYLNKNIYDLLCQQW